MPFPDAGSYYPGAIAGQDALQQQPPQYILDAIGGSYDQSKYAWDQERMALVDRTTGATYGYGHIPNPSLGTDVVTNLSAYNEQGTSAPGTFHFGEGVNPYIGFPGQSYNAGLVPNSGIFLSADPNEIADYTSSVRDRNLQGLARIGAVVGGGAAGAATGSGPLFGGAGAGAAGSGLAPITTTAQTLPGGIPAVTGAGFGATTAATPLASMPAFGGALGGAAAGVPNALAGATGAGPTSTAGGAGGLIGQGGQDMTAALGAGGGGWFDRFLPYTNAGASSLLNAYGVNQAADAESEALQRAIEEQRRQYDLNRSDLMPWVTAGTGALGNLTNAGTAFQTSPGYDWRRTEGQRDIGNSFAARGGAASGNALRALAEFNQGLASGEFGNWWNQQAGLAGVGQNTATNLGAQGTNMAGNVSNALANQGISRASGIVNRYGALGQGLTDSLNWLQRRRLGG